MNKIKSKNNLHRAKLITTLASSGLLLPELSVLVTDSGGDSTFNYLKKRVIDDNILSKPSIQSCQTIWKKLNDRYKFDVRNDLFIFWWNSVALSESYDLAQLATLRWAQSDLLLRFLWKEVYLPRANMDSPVQSEDIISFIHDMKGTFTPRRFFLERSEKVQARIAQHFLLILRDCGAARGKKKKSLSIHPIGESASRYAVNLAREESPGSHEILDHWALRWWGDNSSKADEIIRRVEYTQQNRN
jgi:hypothetical protein